MRNDIKAILKDADLYGYPLTVAQLKTKFTHVSFCTASIPTQGSMCKKSVSVAELEGVNILKTISHRNGAVTLQTDRGFLKFLNI